MKIYGFDSEKGTISQVDAVRCELESAPRQFVFSKDGRFFYLMYQLKNAIDVYSYEYEPGERVPKIERLQTVSSTDTPAGELTAACAIRMSPDDRYLFCSNAGDNCVSIYERDPDTGLLTMKCCLPISGDYPKDIAIFPDQKHMASINHASGTISFFSIDYENGLLMMNHRSIDVNEPNCCVITKIPE